MKKLFISTFALLLALGSMQAQRRNEINVPNLDGYVTLKADLHTHTVFSDGLVWPTVRIDEAYREGLDIISLTEHIEYRPHKEIVADHNRSFELCKKKAKSLGIILIKGSEITRDMPPGHFNALFISDSNPLEQKEWRDAFKEAKKQNAFIFWNHPSWDRQQPDTTLWWKEHTELYNSGCMHGIEVVNGGKFCPEAITWALEKNLAMLGTSDIHQPSLVNHKNHIEDHRALTFIFAKERSEAAVREALESCRTAVYFRNMVIGREELIRPFFEKCIEIKETKRNEKGVTITIENKSDLTLQLKKTAHDTSLVYFRDYTLAPHTKHTINIKFQNGIKGGDMNFEVTNLIVARDKALPYTIKL